VCLIITGILPFYLLVLETEEKQHERRVDPAQR
jgi:hypothetical protein